MSQVAPSLLAWYPRLLHGSIKERNNWCFIRGSSGIHWKQLEDISTKNLILEQPPEKVKHRFNAG
ncbi:MAG: DUF2442 domain-containing protein [Stenomitos rutilans HA7619-LM2]|nr:DUF2442 domain-containing protein [Stenomitos rutilans HA7619-LM2]